MERARPNASTRTTTMAELLGTFAFANDLAFGLAQDDSIRSCYMAVRLAATQPSRWQSESEGTRSTRTWPTPTSTCSATRCS